MAELLQRFSGNPFSTPVGQKIGESISLSLVGRRGSWQYQVSDRSCQYNWTTSSSFSLTNSVVSLQNKQLIQCSPVKIGL